MKPNLSFCIAFTLLIACGNNNAHETSVAEPKQQPETVSNSGTNQPSGNDIIGNWTMTLEAYDENGNKMLDEAERKKGIKNRYSFRFNADGSCLIQQSFKGRYEVKTDSDNKMLYVYRNRVVGEEEQDPPPDVYRIISISKNELVLLEHEGKLTFWVFKRAN